MVADQVAGRRAKGDRSGNLLDVLVDRVHDHALIPIVRAPDLDFAVARILLGADRKKAVQPARGKSCFQSSMPKLRVDKELV